MIHVKNLKSDSKMRTNGRYSKLVSCKILRFGSIVRSINFSLKLYDAQYNIFTSLIAIHLKNSHLTVNNSNLSISHLRLKFEIMMISTGLIQI